MANPRVQLPVEDLVKHEDEVAEDDPDEEIRGHHHGRPGGIQSDIH